MRESRAEKLKEYKGKRSINRKEQLDFDARFGYHEYGGGREPYLICSDGPCNALDGA
jgi:hypothetical protein